jgi:hypothetical protein
MAVTGVTANRKPVGGILVRSRFRLCQGTDGESRVTTKFYFRDHGLVVSDGVRCVNVFSWGKKVIALASDLWEIPTNI